MCKNYFKRLKKSSVALLLGISLLGGSVATYAAITDDFNGVYLSIPTEEYELSTVRRDSIDLYHASLKYAFSNCKEATVAFYIKLKSDDVVASEYLYLTGYDSNKYEQIDYLSRYILRTVEMQLTARTASSHSGYYVTGEWNPNGGLS